MDIEHTVKLLGKTLFVIWFITLFLVGGYAYLVSQGKVFYLEDFLSTVIEINIICGFVFTCLVVLNRFISKKALFLAGILILFVTIIYVRVLPLIKSNIFNDSSTGTIGEVKQFYVDLIFDVMGYPADQTMSTADELFTEVNNYRQEHYLSVLQQDEDLCQIAKSDMQEMYMLSESKNFDVVRTFPKKQNGKTQIGEIIQFGRQPNLARNIIRLKWNHLFSPQKDILNDKNWQFGCAFVSEYNVVFVFSYN